MCIIPTILPDTNNRPFFQRNLENADNIPCRDAQKEVCWIGY